MTARTEYSSILEEVEDPRSSEIAARLPAGPAILWGILLSEKTNFGGCEELAVNTIIELWLAAGFHCPLLSEDALGPIDIDPIPIDHKDSAQRHHSQEVPKFIGPYIVKASPGKGQGIFAARDLSRGQRVLVDTPFFVITKPYNYHKVLRAFEGLSFTNRKQYMQLSCPDRLDDVQLTDVMRIFEANCFNIGEKAAIFLKATRFNHSCLPNTYYSWSETRAEIVFHSMVSIPKGEEMTICYGRPFLSRLERRSELCIYNFQCQCPACRPETAFGQASEARRLAMRGLEEQIIMFQSIQDQARLSYGVRDPLTAILGLIELVKDEGLHGELMTPYRDAADCLKLRGRFREALAFARMEMEEEVVYLGEDSEVVVKTGYYIEELEKMSMGEEEGEVSTLVPVNGGESQDFEPRVEVVEPDTETRASEEKSKKASEEQKHDDLGVDAAMHGATTDLPLKRPEEPTDLKLNTCTPNGGIDELTLSLDEAIPSHPFSIDDDNNKNDIHKSDPILSDHPFSSQSSSPRLVRKI